MPFVKLDCGILRSTLWMDRDAREVFITALLMAEPREYPAPVPEIATRSLDATGWCAPPGWYGFVPAASVGIIHATRIDREAGMAALERLANPDNESRSKEFDGRRLIRVEGGFLALNYMAHRDRDHTAAERQKRLRQRRKKNAEGSASNAVTSRNITQQSRIAESREQSTDPDPPRVFSQGSDPDPDRVKESAPTPTRAHVSETSVPLRDVSAPEAPRADPIRERAASAASVAQAWLRAFGAYWCEQRGGIAYGKPGDAKAAAVLADELAALSESEQNAAWDRRAQMFREFFQSADDACAKSGFRFSWFVQRWEGLRLPTRTGPRPGAPSRYANPTPIFIPDPEPGEPWPEKGTP